MLVVARGSTLPELVAEIRFNGTGRLTGRWEVVSPGDKEPTTFDLLPEASLPIEDRGLQQRYKVVERFDVFLPPTGITTVSGPDVSKIPNLIDGYYKLLFRVEATVDKESNSNAVNGVVAAGGAAGFPMPMLRYYVGNPKYAGFGKNRSELFYPTGHIPVRDRLDFTWSSKNPTGYDRLELEADGEIILTSIIQGGLDRYQAPPWILEQQNKEFKWRITSLNSKGKVMRGSAWAAFIIKSDLEDTPEALSSP